MKYKNIRGYKNVTLYNGIKKKTIQVHRLVAIHFIENPFYLPQVNHKDGNKSNNREDNLEWISNKGNIDHAYFVGLINQVGENNNATKLNDEDVIKILIRGKYASWSKMSKDYNIPKSTLENIIKRNSWKHIQI